MMTKQMKTIGRLIEMKRRNVERAELAHAAAHAKTKAAEQAWNERQQRWHAAVDAIHDIGDALDLEYRDADLRALRRAIDVAEHEHAVARAEEAASRDAMTSARIEHRRFETWMERSVEAQKEETRRLARLADDDVAARKQRAG